MRSNLFSKHISLFTVLEIRNDILPHPLLLRLGVSHRLVAHRPLLPFGGLAQASGGRPGDTAGKTGRVI